MQALSKSHRQSPPNVQGFASITIGLARGWIRKVRDWKSVDWFHLQQDLHSSLQLCTDLFRPIDSPETLSVYERALTTNIQQAVDRHVHFKQICEFSKSWWTAEIRELRQRENKLRRIWAPYGPRGRPYCISAGKTSTLQCNNQGQEKGMARLLLRDRPGRPLAPLSAGGPSSGPSPSGGFRQRQ